jgi:hypothetical protein
MTMASVPMNTSSHMAEISPISSRDSFISPPP